MKLFTPIVLCVLLLGFSSCKKMPNGTVTMKFDLEATLVGLSIPLDGETRFRGYKHDHFLICIRDYMGNKIDGRKVEWVGANEEAHYTVFIDEFKLTDEEWMECGYDINNSSFGLWATIHNSATDSELPVLVSYNVCDTVDEEYDEDCDCTEYDYDCVSDKQAMRMFGKHAGKEVRSAIINLERDLNG